MPTLSQNKKARHEYEILQTYEAGLVLSGAEVKSVRAGQVNLKGSYVTFHNGEAELMNTHIAPYKFASTQESYDPTHSRRLLLRKKEIAYLNGKLAEKGLTIVPLSLYTKGRHIKVEIGVARGKKQFDKRRTIKDKELRRETDRAIKNSRG